MMSEFFKKHVLTKSFLMGMLFCMGSMSHYIFGADNLLEDVVELILKKETGKTVDFSPEGELPKG